MLIGESGHIFFFIDNWQSSHKLLGSSLLKASCVEIPVLIED